MDVEPIPMVDHKVVALDTYRLIRNIREVREALDEATGLTPELRRTLQEAP